MSRKRKKSTNSKFGKVGNWGDSSWKDTAKPTTNKRNDRDNKQVTKAFK